MKACEESLMWGCVRDTHTHRHTHTRRCACDYSWDWTLSSDWTPSHGDTQHTVICIKDKMSMSRSDWSHECKHTHSEELKWARRDHLFHQVTWLHKTTNKQSPSILHNMTPVHLTVTWCSSLSGVCLHGDRCVSVAECVAWNVRGFECWHVDPAAEDGQRRKSVRTVCRSAPRPEDRHLPVSTHLSACWTLRHLTDIADAMVNNDVLKVLIMWQSRCFKIKVT